MRLLRVPEILTRRGDRTTKLYADIKRGVWPPLIKYGPRCSVQPEHEVDAMLAAITAGASEDELRALVTALVKARRAEFVRLREQSSAAPSAA